MEIKHIKDKTEEYLKSTITLTKLSGDASAREYFFAEEGNEKYIVCVEEPNGQQSTDFIKMHALLEGIRKPSIKYYNLEDSIIIQEHLGDQSLNLVLAKYKDEQKKILSVVIDDIFTYQSIEKESFKIFDNRSFDREKIEFEFNLACDFFLEKYLRINLSDSELATLENTREFLVNYFESRMDVICHRDYHGRNLIYKDSKVWHIDFQDARIGPKTYDLASLLEDCYFDIGTKLRDELKNYFFKKSDFEKYSDFEKEYSIVAAQRIFKAIGSFTYLTIDKKKGGYERYIGYAFEKLRLILEDIPELHSFNNLLKEKYYEH